MKRHRSLSPIDNLRKHQTVFVEPKSTLDNWNHIPKRISKQNEQIDTRPIHVDPHSHIDTWSDQKKSYRRLRPKLLRVNIINIFVIESKSFFNIFRHQNQQ
jgi:hypothetical protein